MITSHDRLHVDDLLFFVHNEQQIDSLGLMLLHLAQSDTTQVLSHAHGRRPYNSTPALFIRSLEHLT